MLAAVTMLQAGNVKSSELNNREISSLEMELISEIEQFYSEAELSLEEAIIMEMEEEKAQISVYDNENNLIASGDPKEDNELRKLVNKAEYLSSLGSKDYYRLSE